MNDDELITLWIGAFRYYCGRMTYAVSDFCNALIKNWNDVPEMAKAIIRRELEAKFNDAESRANGDSYHPLGMDCDRKSWESVRELWS